MNPAQSKYGIKVISGGQTGVDIAGLRAAQCLGIPTGGTAAKGWKTLAGPRPQLQQFGLTEATGGYAYRTRKNVQDSSATLVLALNFESSGTKLTLETAHDLGKPCFKFELPSPSAQRLELKQIGQAVSFIRSEAEKVKEPDSFILNIAGNSSHTAGGIFIPAFVACIEILTKLAIDTDIIGGATVKQLRDRLLSDGQLIHALNDNFDYYQQLDPRRPILIV